MILRSIVFFVLLIALCDAYILWRYFRRSTWWKRLLWLLPSLAMLVWTDILVMEPGFLHGSGERLFLYLFFIGLLVMPKWAFSIPAAIGHAYCKLFHRRRNYGAIVGLIGVLATWHILFWGSFKGFNKLRVRHIDYVSADVPQAFNGYRMVVFSDAHVGTYTGKRQKLLENAIDSINSQQADIILFAGDLQNTSPEDLYPQRNLLSLLSARDGVAAVLGNHDYAEYIEADSLTKVANCRETQSLIRQMGWQLLMNSSLTVTRGNDSIVVAGMENDGEGRFPQLGSLDCLPKQQCFTVMLEHDPTSWSRRILQHNDSLSAGHTPMPQLTISGHTHGMQFALLGLSPVRMVYKHWGGMYESKDHRRLFVSTGLGGLIPFRFGLPGEIVVITLKTNDKP